eukprot:TRINITY_DN3208_c1_g1_i2.p1 TRINITY_DN3208_c1_g1~~TRINITY_DN3208_c1_g1_i2.p1  ORF type:complete len:200 (+),score=19.57 TRINITY_DN3208_c1_g1_i2:140-739(+)
MIFSLILILSYIFYFFFGTICLATGLYYLAEFVEEYASFTKKLIWYTILTVFVLYIFIIILEDFPIQYTIIGLFAHVCYLRLLTASYPILEFTDPSFILSCAMAVINHISWFYLFTYKYTPFNQIIAFFVICVWMVPFQFFISLSVNENTLPGNPDNIQVEMRRKKSSNRLKTMFTSIKKKQEEILPDILTSSGETKLI